MTSQRPAGSGLPSTLESRIREAREHLKAAEQDVEKTLAEVRVVPRADKTMISNALEETFARVARARHTLEGILDELQAGSSDQAD